MKTKTIPYAILSLALVGILSGCGGEQAAAPAEPEAQIVFKLLQNDLLTVDYAALTNGPMISGSLQPVVRAALNAEVSGIVTKVVKDNGDLVKKGDLLLQIDQTTFRDKVLSAQESERAALVTSQQATKQLKRMQSLYQQNLVTAESLENAEIKANQAQSDLASAKARLVEAKQQLERTEIRAPFSGVVSAKLVSAGDTAQIGKALMTVIDPDSMRFEGFIAAEQVGAVQVGQAVSFRVNGYGDTVFQGTVERINPQANDVTRQVQIFVTLKDQQSFVAGLYAEGYIAVKQQQSLMLPSSAVVREGDSTFVWKLDADKLHKIRVHLGAKDPRFGDYQVVSGLEQRQQVLRYPQGALREGATVALDTTTPATADATVKGN